jgi:methionyl-tRNA formyltransferase
MGTGEIALPVLRWLIADPTVNLVGVVTQPDKPVGRSQTLTPPLPKVLAQEHSIPFFQPTRVRAPEALEPLRRLQLDLIVVMAYGQILPRALLEMPRIACLNLHASLLPKHRGAAPVQAAILAGDTETGITVMYMAEGLDTGDVLLQRAIRIRRRETGGSLHDRLAQLAPEALAEAVPLLIAGKAPRIPQTEAEATYASKLDRDSGRIDWTRDHASIDRQIRAMNPWPGAYGEMVVDSAAPKRLKIHRALPMRRRSGAPGAVLAVTDRGIIVGCGQGALLLREVQLEGKRRLPVAEFLRGFPTHPGVRFLSLGMVGDQ